MAGTSLLTLIDDIATLLDDVSIMTKVAAKKTAGVLGDDLALNAEQVTGVDPKRELPVVWAVAKGATLNKAILVPAALAINAFIPWLVTPLLMLGGAFLSYEGFEKVLHKFLHSEEDSEEHHKEMLDAVRNPEVDMVAFEKKKIRGAIRTDFILSAEIIVIALGTLAADATFAEQLGVLVAIAVIVNVGVYGLVAGIVKLDDIGLHLREKASATATKIGEGILFAAPIFMKLLGIVGTIAMFLVGGGILRHGFMEWIPSLYETLHHWEEGSFLIATLMDGVTGVVAGGILVAILTPIMKAVKAAKS